MGNAKLTKEKKIHFRKIFYPFLAFMYGIIVARGLYRGEIEKIILTSIVFIVVAVIFCLNKRFIALSIITIMFFIGNGFYYLGIRSYNVIDYSNNIVCVEGRISDDIQKSNYGYSLLLDDVKINNEKGQKISLYISSAKSAPIVGQRIIFEGKLDKIKPFNLKSFNSFSYRTGARYNARISKKDIIFLDNIKVKSDETIKLAVKDVVYKNMSEDNAGIAMAMLFGDKNDLNDEIASTYKNVGIIHILTVSGLHIGFLIAVVYGFLKKCRTNKYLCLSLTFCFIFFYAYLCGFTPSVMRAGIMAIIMILAKTFSQQYDSLNSLGLAGFIICFIKPLSPFDIGFLMSFFSVFSIICLSRMFIKFFSKFLPYKIATLLAVTTSAQLGILPFLAYFGGQIHLFSFVVNLLVLPLLSVLFPFLFVVSLIGTFINFIGYLLILVDYGFVFINLIAQFFERSHLIIPVTVTYFSMTIIYFVLILFIGEFCMIESQNKLALFSLVTFIMVVMLGCYNFFPIKNQTSVSYIGSANNLSVIITSAKGESLLVGYNYNLVNYKRSYYINKFDTYLSLDGRISGDYEQIISNLGIKFFYSFSGVSENAKIIPTECDISIGSFVVRYKVLEGEMAGLLIKVDNQCIFVASEGNLSYNAIENEIVIKENAKIVITKNQIDNRVKSGYILMSQLAQEYGEFSYQKDGNVKFLYEKNAWIARGLD